MTFYGRVTAFFGNRSRGPFVVTAIKYLALLEYGAERHVTMREDVLKVFADAYGHQLYGKNDVKRAVDFEVRLRNLDGETLVCLPRLRMATKVVQVYRTRFTDDENVDLFSYANLLAT
jgi:hypothetical protein